jgi:hypothetical protein
MRVVLALLLGYLAVLSAAVFHSFALQNITTLVPRQKLDRQGTSFIVFALLTLAHLIEITAFAGYVYTMKIFLWPDSFAGFEPATFGDILYLSGINFTTLGLTKMELVGPLRLVIMMQSVAGFMLLTWSAAYLYRASGDYWRDER